MSKTYIHHSCSFCGNDWTIEDGYNPETKQCPPCDAWDAEKPARRLAEEQQREWEKNNPMPNFPYMSGDPYW